MPVRSSKLVKLKKTSPAVSEACPTKALQDTLDTAYERRVLAVQLDAGDLRNLNLKVGFPKQFRFRLNQVVSHKAY